MARPRRRGNAERTRTQDFLDTCADMGNERVGRYQLYRDFYNGDHNTQLTDRAQEFLERQVKGLRFHENFTEPVVDVMSERLQVTRFTTGSGDEGRNEEAEATMNSVVWAKNRMDAAQNVVHTNALMLGDAFVVVDLPVDGEPRITYNDAKTVRPFYSAEQPDEMEFASKVWNTTSSAGMAMTRLNLYYPDRVERYFRLTEGGSGGNWNEYTDDAGATIPWTDPAGEPLGIPVFHFANKSLGRAFGRSEIHSTIPQQQLLNKFVIDLAMTLDAMGWPQRWTTGVDPVNANFKNVISDVWVIPDEDVKVGQFPAADPAGLVEAIENTISRIARRSRTPLHLLAGGDMPSGEALKTAEAGLVKKVEDRQSSWGNVWEDVQRMALKLAGTQLDPDMEISTEWDDAQSRNEKDEAETALMKIEVGVSQQTMIAELGYDPEKEAMLREQESVANQNAAARAMDAGMFGEGEPVVPESGDEE